MKLHLSVCLMAALAAAPVLAQAQAKPAADNKTATLGAGSSKGPILTRDELRSCLADQESLRTRTAEHETKRAPLDTEKESITADQAALRTERSALDDLRKQSDELGARITAHSARVEAWNKRVTDFNASNRIGPDAERERRQINKERDEIDAASKVLNDDRARIQASTEGAVNAFNAKATALDGRVNDWNQRNQVWNDAGRALEASRKSWLANCGDRRYREDDEIAIKRGK